MNNLESTTELNGILQKNIEWQKQNIDTLRFQLKKTEQQLAQSNYNITNLEKKVIDLKIFNISLAITTTFLIILLASK
jgi:septal ring factor EnvC (AmiA/AmiB activator)